MCWNKTVATSVVEILFESLYEFSLAFVITNNNTDTCFLSYLFLC